VNIWTAFFLVLSIVILASPVLLYREGVERNGEDTADNDESKTDPEDEELELDLASGRITLEDYEVMSGRKTGPIAEPDDKVKGDHGNLPEN
jgi:hypothetical protein